VWPSVGTEPETRSADRREQCLCLWQGNRTRRYFQTTECGALLRGRKTDYPFAPDTSSCCGVAGRFEDGRTTVREIDTDLEALACRGNEAAIPRDEVGNALILERKIGFQASAPLKVRGRTRPAVTVVTGSTKPLTTSASPRIAVIIACPANDAFPSNNVRLAFHTTEPTSADISTARRHSAPD